MKFELIKQLTKELCIYLDHALPQLSGNWWQNHVIAKLSPQQVQFVKQRRINSLPGLDLAALLRILDRNWIEVSNLDVFPLGTRNFVKEMQSIRNRWAHADSVEVGKDDLFRDLDTMQRLAIAINADKNFIAKVKEEKQKLINLQPFNQAGTQTTSINSMQVSDSECLCCKKGLSFELPRVCPECHHIFKGIGWGGIDAHWRAHHESSGVMYEQFRDSLCKKHR